MAARQEGEHGGVLDEEGATRLHEGVQLIWTQAAVRVRRDATLVLLYVDVNAPANTGLMITLVLQMITLFVTVLRGCQRSSQYASHDNLSLTNDNAIRNCFT